MLTEEALALQSTGSSAPLFMEKTLICLGCLITAALICSIMHVVENICSILQQLVWKRVHTFKHLGGFKFLANELHYLRDECGQSHRELPDTHAEWFHLASKREPREKNSSTVYFSQYV